MKNTIIKWLPICIVALFTFSCNPKCDFNIKKPNDVKPVDWESYNDVYTVFWNYLTENTRGAGYPTGKTIKICGKIDAGTFSYTGSSLHYFVLMDEQEHGYNDIYNRLPGYGYQAPSVRVFCYHVADELLAKLNTCDLTKECYIKGELGTVILGGDTPRECRVVVPDVYLYSIDDIYFEEKE